MLQISPFEAPSGIAEIISAETGVQRGRPNMKRSRGAYMHGEQAREIIGITPRGKIIYAARGGAGASRQQSNPATSADANAAARAALFQQGFFSSIELPSQPWVDGGSYTFDMPHAGIGLYCELRFTGTLTWTGANAPLLSSLAPFNLVQSAVFKDYLGNTRINAGGPTLHMVEALKKWMYSSDETANTQADRAYPDAVAPGSNVPIGVFSPTGTTGVGVPYDFGIQIPFSFHEDTTVGTLPFTVPAGNNTLYVTLNPAVNPIFGTKNAESPLQANVSAPTVTLTGTVNVTYYFIDPLPGMPLPLMDFSQVYEIVDVRSTDNLSASATKQLLLPTGRTYQALYGQLVNGGQYQDNIAGVPVISALRFLINEATPTLQENYPSYLHRIRRTYGRDMIPGQMIWDLRARPISPSNYGSIALQMILGNNFAPAGETYFTLGKESLYVIQNQVY